MIKKLLVLLVLIGSFAHAQQPYYSGIDFSQSGLDLKDDLATLIINTHTNALSYSDIWDACRITDEDSSNTNNVVLLYGWEDGSDGDVTNDRSRGKLDNGGNVGDWNREHTFPRSLGNPPLDDSGTFGPPYSDAHNLRPTDVQRNGSRGSQAFATGSGTESGNVTNGWYPGDEWKGDVARMMMYMYLRYGNQCLPSVVGVGNNAGAGDDMIDLFLQWNAEDPVSVLEDARNTYHDGSDTFSQGNRNPFIDNPRLATEIWGGTPAEDRWGIFNTDTEAPSVPTGLTVSNETTNSLDLSWAASTDNIGVTEYDVYVEGVLDQSVNTTSATITGLTPETTYALTVAAKDAANNVSPQSAAINGTTLPTGGNTSGLFFSEYVEGSGFNKALEIANFTGSDVDLSTYSVRRDGNGGGTWDSGVTLSGMLVDGDVFVIVNSDIDAGCFTAANADLQVNNTTPMNFNGNDPIGLFESGVLIDVIGVFGGGTGNFAQNETLRRKSTVSGPNTTFDKAGEWDSFPSNTCDGLGTHNVTLSNPIFQDQEISIYPNPTRNGEVFIQLNTDSIEEIEIFSLAGQRLFKTEVNAQGSFTIDQPAGLYLLKVRTDNRTFTKKLVIQ